MPVHEVFAGSIDLEAVALSQVDGRTRYPSMTAPQLQQGLEVMEVSDIKVRRGISMIRHQNFRLFLLASPR